MRQKDLHKIVMEIFLYYLTRVLLALIDILPIQVVARLVRFFGTIAYYLDARHRKMAISNLSKSFDLPEPEIKALALENFKRIGENFICAAKTISMKKEKLAKHLKFVGIEKLENAARCSAGRNVVVAIGHFGNFELYARGRELSNGLKYATTYRGLKQKSFDQLLQYLRLKTGCYYFERRTEAHKLQEFMHQGNVILGLLADQHAGDKGVWVPFFGRNCSTSAAPAVFALRYKSPLFTAICYRTALAKWEVVIGDEIPTLSNGKPRDIKDICIDINKAFESAVRKDPANWFWVHNRWKPPPQHKSNHCVK